MSVWDAVFNWVFCIIIGAFLIIWGKNKYSLSKQTEKQRKKNQKKKQTESQTTLLNMSKTDEFLQKYQWILFGAVFIIAAVIRFINFPYIPAGFNQDEAAIAVDSISIMRHGVDRNGYAFPVYPVSWGAGQGPFYMYFAIPFMWIFGDGVFGFRIGNVLLSLASVVAVYFMFRETHSVKAGLMGMLLFAVSPWNVFLSRWSLDANPLPSLFIIGVCLFVLAISKQKTSWYVWAAAVLAISLYSYGASYVAIPLFLAFMIPYLLFHKKITWKQTIWAGVTFVLISLPLFMFLIINYCKLPEIVTPFFSIPRLTVMRSNAIFKTFSGGMADVSKSFSDYWNMVFMQKPDLPWNSVKEYGIIYLFSLPLMLFGVAALCFKTKIKKFTFEYMYLAMFISASVLVLLINPNINRAHIMFVPVICLIVIAVDTIGKKIKWSVAGTAVAYLIAFCMFFGYYANDYNRFIGPNFFESFDQAIVYADENSDGPVYVAMNINGNYLLTLFHTKGDMNEFRDTVKYYDNNAEFRFAVSYGKYIFNIPEQKDPKGYYVVRNSDLNQFDKNIFNIQQFKYYSVVYPR